MSTQGFAASKAVCRAACACTNHAGCCRDAGFRLFATAGFEFMLQRLLDQVSPVFTLKALQIKAQGKRSAALGKAGHREVFLPRRGFSKGAASFAATPLG
jgi:hypothetical protein